MVISQSLPLKFEESTLPKIPVPPAITILLFSIYYTVALNEFSEQDLTLTCTSSWCPNDIQIILNWCSNQSKTTALYGPTAV